MWKTLLFQSLFCQFDIIKINNTESRRFKCFRSHCFLNGQCVHSRRDQTGISIPDYPCHFHRTPRLPMSLPPRAEPNVYVSPLKDRPLSERNFTVAATLFKISSQYWLSELNCSLKPTPICPFLNAQALSVALAPYNSPVGIFPVPKPSTPTEWRCAPPAERPNTTLTPWRADIEATFVHCLSIGQGPVEETLGKALLPVFMLFFRCWKVTVSVLALRSFLESLLTALLLLPGVSRSLSTCVLLSC